MCVQELLNWLVLLYIVNMYIANLVSWFQYPEMHKVLKIEVKDSGEQIIIKSKHYHYKSHEQKDEKKPDTHKCSKI